MPYRPSPNAHTSFAQISCDPGRKTLFISSVNVWVWVGGWKGGGSVAKVCLYKCVCYVCVCCAREKRGGGLVGLFLFDPVFDPVFVSVLVSVFGLVPANLPVCVLG